MGLSMQLRGVVALAAASFAGSLVAVPAGAGEYLKPEQAKQFLAGKLFSYTCFEGTTGAGRIHADGSVIGTIRVRGNGPSRFVMLPKDTIRIKSDSICASVHGLPISPCFNVEQIDANSFRGSISGLGFAACTFTRRGPRMQVAELPVSLQAPGASAKHVFRPRAVKSADATPRSVGAPAAEPELKLRPSTRD